METLETITNGAIVAFPSESQFLIYLNEHPNVRDGGRIVREKSFRGQCIRLLITLESAEEVRKMQLAEWTRAAQAKRSYTRSVAIPMGSNAWELLQLRQAAKMGYDEEETKIFLETMRRESAKWKMPAKDLI